jgi:hypothetical protein
MQSHQSRENDSAPFNFYLASIYQLQMGILNFWARLSVLLFISFHLFGCKSNTVPPPSPYFEPGIAHGTLDNDEIHEASGIVMSINNPGKLWVHNDSGDKARLFLIDDSARYLATVHLPAIHNRDWEDIALGPGPNNQKSYIYIGDIGDNNAHFPSKYIYRIEEPMLQDGCTDTSIFLVDTIQFILPDGPRDAEALCINHRTLDLYIFSKRESRISLYQLKYPYSTTKINIALKMMDLPFTQVVAADWSLDNKELLIKTYKEVYYWSSQADTSLDAILQTPAISLPYIPEPQGEAIAWDHQRAGFYTISERVGFTRPVLYFYKRK